MNQTSAISIQNLTKSYGKVQALRGVNLEVQRGEVFGFLGPNGAGKTTTIRCLLDLIRPSAGSIRVLGIDPQIDPVAVRSRSGYLPGELHVEENLTAEGLMKYFDQLRGNHVDWMFVRQLADRLQLDLKTSFKNMSKGNKQKVGLIQALMHRPELLLLDEPTAGLDPLIQQEALKLIGEARANGTTVFFSSHILSEVQEIADRVGIIRSGQVVEIAATAALINRSLQRARIKFKQAIDSEALSKLPGVKILARDATSIILQVEGEMDTLIKTLANYPVRDFETERPSLEEIFLAYYEPDQTKAQA
ncbi:MAG TPA: ABC transporter ATP-binding protein [Anaerolineae bacterium]|nr:ABC transporter ATP-binding protein [Anaerolineae bacterium]